MSKENVETLTRIYEAWEQGDFTAGVPFFDEDAALVIDPEIPDAGTYEGLDGFRRYTRGFLDAWETLTIVAESYREAPEAVLVKVKQTGVGKDSGIPVSTTSTSGDSETGR